MARLAVLEWANAKAARDVIELFDIEAIRTVVLRLDLNLVGNLHSFIVDALLAEALATKPQLLAAAGRLAKHFGVDAHVIACG